MVLDLHEELWNSVTTIVVKQVALMKQDCCIQTDDRINVKSILHHRIAKFASSEKSLVDPKDMYLYSSKMCAIASLAEAVLQLPQFDGSRTMVAYG